MLGRRGLEQLLRAIALLPPRFHVGLLGPAGRPSVRESLDGLARELGVRNRVHWFGSVPHENIPSVLATATCSVIPLQNVNRSYDLTLPNKLFDSIMAGVPVGVGRLSEMQRFVTKHRIGIVFDERDPVDIASAVQELEAMSRDPDGQLAARFADLQCAIGWERQASRLLHLYRNSVCNVL
jgi:glycosyltransferase involved in cell wall biosynthesis